MPLRLDLLTLRVVIAVADCGSISAGSDSLQLAVAAASARISALESELGIRIFERSPRGVELTPVGRLLVQRGRELVDDADRLVTELRDWSLGLAGHVRMLANASALLQVVAVLPSEALLPQLQQLPLKAVPLDEDWARRTHYLALRIGEDVPAPARTLVEALRSGPPAA